MATVINLNDSTPAAPAGKKNVKWQGDALDPRDVSAYVDDGGVNEQSGTSYTVDETDNRKLVNFNNASAVSVAITASATLGNGFFCWLENLGAGTVTLTPDGSETIDGASSLTLDQDQGLMLFSDGSNLFTSRGKGSSGSTGGGVNVVTSLPAASSLNRGQLYLLEGISSSNYESYVTSQASLVHFYKCDETSGTTITDSKGSNNGTLAGTVTLGAAGYVNYGYTFGGGTGSIPLPVQDDFTIDFWIKTSATAPSGLTNWYDGWILVGRDIYGVVNDYGISMANGGQILAGTGNPDVTIASTASVNDGSWHHVVFTRVKSTGVSTLYVDGTSQGSVTGGTNSLNAASSIYLGGSSSFAGMLDEVAFYDSALSADVISGAADDKLFVSAALNNGASFAMREIGLIS